MKNLFINMFNENVYFQDNFAKIRYRPVTYRVYLGSLPIKRAKGLFLINRRKNIIEIMSMCKWS